MDQRCNLLDAVHAKEETDLFQSKVCHFPSTVESQTEFVLHDKILGTAYNKANGLCTKNQTRLFAL